MLIKVALTEEIINESLALHYKSHPKAKRKKRDLFIIPTLMLCLSAYLIYSEAQQPNPGQGYYMALLYIPFAIIYYFLMRRRLVKSGGKVLANMGEYANFNVDVRQSEIITTTPSDTITSYWTDFAGAVLSPEIVLLYQANNSFTMLHKSFFTNNEFQEFKKLVEQNVQPVYKAEVV